MICTSPSLLPLPEKSISSSVAWEQIFFSSVGRELDLIRGRLPNRARFDSSLITRVVTRARVGFRARVTYFELSKVAVNISAKVITHLLSSSVTSRSPSSSSAYEHFCKNYVFIYGRLEIDLSVSVA